MSGAAGARYERHPPRLPDTRELLERVETLGDFELEIPEQAIRGARNTEPMLERHLAYQLLAVEVTQRNKQIADKALENERKAGQAGSGVSGV